MFLIAENKVQREHARLRSNSGGVGGRGDDEIDIARTDLLQHHRFLSQLGARELIDAQLATAQLLELGIENVCGDAIGGCARLIIGEGEFSLRLRWRRQ
jgi:hypothetical protein